MIAYSKIRGTMKSVINVEVNIDTIYIRSNIVSINETDFKGWEYDEIQYSKDEYTELLQKQIDDGKSSSDFMGMLLVEKDMQVMGLQNSSGTLGEQIVQMDIRLMMGGM